MIAVGLCVMVVALPNLAEVVANARIRGAMSNVAATAQACRIQAVKENTSKRMHIGSVNGRLMAFVKSATDASNAPATGDTQVVLPAGVNLYSAPTGEGSPSQLTAEIMWGSGMNPDTGKDTYFNSRGMPCDMDADGVCGPTPGFVYYFSIPRSLGGVTWAALGVSPAGRVKAWYWNGSYWGCD